VHHRPLVLALVVFAGAAIGLGSQAASARPAIADRLDALFTGLHDRGLFDGAVIVGTPLEVIWQKGFGPANREAGAAVAPGAFYVPGLDFIIGFGTGADGRISRMHVSTNLTESWERRVK
jgi:hypothetical protein